MRTHALLAQLVEQRFYTAKVGGSNPSGRTMQKVIFFDLDGTLTSQSTWLLLNQRLGITAEEDRKLFQDYLENKFDYKEWMKALVDSYKSKTLVTKNDLITFAQGIELRPESQPVIDDAKAKGYTVAIISGALDIIVSIIAQKLGVDVWFAKTKAVFNEQGEFVDMETTTEGERDGKLHLVEAYCTANSIDIKEVVCVEDGGNGLELFKHAKGILLGDNAELKPFVWKQVENLSEIQQLLE